VMLTYRAVSRFQFSHSTEIPSVQSFKVTGTGDICASYLCCKHKHLMAGEKLRCCSQGAIVVAYPPLIWNIFSCGEYLTRCKETHFNTLSNVTSLMRLALHRRFVTAVNKHESHLSTSIQTNKGHIWKMFTLLHS
jgi:hypothetical protein